MSSAPLPAGLSTQPPQGSGVRFFRRLGGAVRRAITGGIALAARRRPQRPEKSSLTLAAPSDKAPLAPRQPRAAHRPSAIAPATPSRRQGWFARWFRPKRRPPASLARAAWQISDDTPCNLEDWSDLSPEARAFFNTPVEECDPDELRLVLAAVARHIAGSLPPELGMDAEALFSTLCGRLLTEPAECSAGRPARRGAGPATGDAGACHVGCASDVASAGAMGRTGGHRGLRSGHAGHQVGRHCDGCVCRASWPPAGARLSVPESIWTACGS